MGYTARIFKTDRRSFMIYMESLSFYVGNTLQGAGLELIENAPITKGNVAIFREDMPLIKASTVKKIISFHEKTNNEATAGPNDEFFIVSAETYNEILSLISDKESFVEFRTRLKAKYTAVNIFSEISKKERLIVDSSKKLDKAARVIKKRINKRHMKAGVFFADSNASYIGPKVKIGEGSLILPGTCIEGETIIGSGCVIGPNSRLVDMEIGDKVTVSNAVALESKIGSETSIGPFAYIRPHCIIGDHVKVGDFVEIKNATIGNHSKASHLAYVGDADLGERINIGCGTITVNYDGKLKHRTVIEDEAFIGSNSNLVAPVTIKSGAFIAAGSTITEDVPENALGIARARQVVKADWGKK